jgi:hypothetical protein
MKKLCLTFVWIVVAGVLSSSLVSAQGQENQQQGNQQIDRYITMLRTDLTAQKAALIVSNMHLTEAETEAFWPVYRKYNKELDKVGDAKVAVIKDYATHLDSIDDKKAKELTAKALKVEEQRLRVIKKYIGEFDKVLSAKQVARFFQLEMQMQRMVDLQVAAELPLVK